VHLKIGGGNFSCYFFGKILHFAQNFGGKQKFSRKNNFFEVSKIV
jgi:hypothetical protein